MNRITPHQPIASTAFAPAISLTRRAWALGPICTEARMRINCPYCGERDQAEFSYFGDASKTRPADPMADAATVFDYVYLRENRAGKMDEFWYHGAGCHAWLIVT